MKKNLYVMYAIALLQGMIFYGPVATLYRQAQGISVFQITVIESISLVVWIALEIPWGMVADKIGYRRTMVFCCGLYFISKVVFWKADSFGDFLLERLLLCVVMAGMSGVDSGIIYLSCQGRDSQKAFGIYDSMGMVGLLGAAGVFALAVRDNYPLAGLLTVISYGLAALLSLLLTEVKPTALPDRPAEPFRVTLKATLANRQLLWFLVAAALLTETHQTVTVFLNQLQYERCGLGNTAIGLIYIVATLTGALGVYSATVTKRLGTGRSLWLFGGLAAAACLTLALTAHAVPAVLGVLTLRLSNTLFQPLRAELQNRQIHTDNRATALSVHSMLMNGVAIGTNLLFGALSERSLPAAFGFGAGICGIGLFLFCRWYRNARLQA